MILKNDFYHKNHESIEVIGLYGTDFSDGLLVMKNWKDEEIGKHII